VLGARALNNAAGAPPVNSHPAARETNAHEGAISENSQTGFRTENRVVTVCPKIESGAGRHLNDASCRQRNDALFIQFKIVIN